MSPHEHLTLMPADERLDLLAPPVAAVIWSLPSARVFEIDPDLADTAALCAAYDLPLSTSANCVVVTGRRAGQERHAACVALATTRVNVNSVVRRRLDVRKVSFSPREATVANTGMEFWWDHAPWASPGMANLDRCRSGRNRRSGGRVRYADVQTRRIADRSLAVARNRGGSGVGHCP